MSFLRALGADIARSPVSGMCAILCSVAAGVSLGMGNIDRALLYAILGTVMLIGRKDDT